MHTGTHNITGRQHQQTSSELRQLLTILLSAFALWLQAQNEVRFVFTGEVNMGSNYGMNSASTAGTAQLMAEASPLLQKADITFATLGTVFIDIDASPNRTNMIGAHRLIRMPEACAAEMAEVGFTAVSLAGSHVADFGIEGIQTTINSLRDAKMEYAGVKAMQDYMMFERQNRRYGLIAFGTSVHTLSMADSTLVRNMVSGLDEQCDIVIVAYSIDHSSPASPQHIREGEMHSEINFAHVCINAGADIVIGNGHTQPQPIELYKDRLIIYDLGHFCTPATSQPTNQGVAPLIEANIFADGTFKNGKIVSFKQKGTSGPKTDTTHESAKIIKAATQRQFPKTELEITDDGQITSTSESSYALAMRMLSEAERHKGKRYRMGATGPNQFDCSGFTSYVFAKFGIKLERMSAAQYTQGRPVDRKDLRPGDLVFFTRSSVRGVGHVGIVYSVDKRRGSFKFIHAAVSTGITINDFASSAYYIKRYVGARRILPD